ncbi:hypothetical protein [Halomicrococcus gelatinilyticus]|uniref:hypothetical protein n=1 Tax=Halomicrococcus gelatinilyticus TaxID=1702103 RepID=UPI002E141ED1
MVNAVGSARTGVRALLASLVVLVGIGALATAGLVVVLGGATGQQALGLLLASVLAASVFVVLAAVVTGWLLARTIVSTARSLSTACRIDMVRRATAFEASNPPARWVRLADRVAVLDPRTHEERTTDALDELRGRYVDGELTERELEAGLKTVLDADGSGRRVAEVRPRASGSGRAVDPTSESAFADERLRVR